MSEPEGTPGIAGQPSAPFQRRQSLKASKGTCQLHRARGGEPRCSLSGSGSFHCPRALISGISSGRKMTGEKHASFCIYRQESLLGDASQQSQKERGLKPYKEGTGGEGFGRDTRVPDSHSHSPLTHCPGEAKQDPGTSPSFLALKESIKPLWVQGGPGLGSPHETGVEQTLSWLASAL